MIEIVLLLVGAVIGVGCDRGWTVAARRMQSARSTRVRRRASAMQARLPGAVLSYFASRGLLDQLYEPATLSTGPIAVLFDASLSPARTLGLDADGLIVVEHADRVEFRVDHRLVERKIAAGANLWDGSVLYVKDFSLADDGTVVISAAECNYFSYVSLAARLQREFLAAAEESPTLDPNFASVTSVLRSGIEPITIACAVACVFGTDAEPVVALHRRASSVVNAAGMLGVAPLFGLESNTFGPAASRFNVLTYNFIKEFLEEFYGLETHIHAAETAALDPDWVLRDRRAQALIDELESGRATIECLGCGIECSDGTLTYVLMAKFDSPAFLKNLRSEAQPGWELAGVRPGGRAIEFVTLDGVDLQTYASPSKMSSTSIFALDLVRQRLLWSDRHGPPSPGDDSSRP